MSRELKPTGRADAVRLRIVQPALSSIGLALTQAGYMAAAWEAGGDAEYAFGDRMFCYWTPGCGRPMR